MSNLTIQITDSLRASLDDLGRRNQRPVEDIAREILEKALYLEEFRQLREELRPYAKAAGFETEEDIFKAVS